MGTSSGAYELKHEWASEYKFVEVFGRMDKYVESSIRMHIQ